MQQKNFGTIPGSTGTTFDVVAAFSAGKVGFRSLGADGFRVRVVPANGTTLDLTSSDGWRQPGEDGQNRYSTVVKTTSGLAQAIAAATKALAAESVTVSIG